MGKPSPQLYAYKKEKLQELEELDSKGELVLYYAVTFCHASRALDTL